MPGAVAGLNSERIGVMVGSAFGGMETYEAQTLKLAASGPKKVTPPALGCSQQTSLPPSRELVSMMYRMMGRPRLGRKKLPLEKEKQK